MEMEHREPPANAPMKRRMTRTTFAIIVAGAVLIGCGILLAMKSLITPHPPAVVSAQATATLYGDAHELQRLLKMPTDKPVSSNVYLQITEDIRKQCARVPVTLDKSKVPVDIRNGIAELHKNSYATCQSLRPLSNSYLALYGPMLPLLDIDTTPRRYQTLPVIQQHLQDKHKEVLEAATTAVSKDAPGDYESAVRQQLPALKKQVESSKNLSYLRQIRDVQLRLASEQSVYWQSYADLDGLEQYLASQTDGYCSYLPKAGIPKALCQQAEKAVE